MKKCEIVVRTNEVGDLTLYALVDGTLCEVRNVVKFKADRPRFKSVYINADFVGMAPDE